LRRLPFYKVISTAEDIGDKGDINKKLNYSGGAV
jgi:hypothetical protein